MFFSATFSNRRAAAAFLAAALYVSVPAGAKTIKTQEQALQSAQSAFPAGTSLARQPLFLSRSQVEAARKASGLEFNDELVVRYVARRGQEIVGYVYFDSHRVRTLPETLMFVITPEARIERIEVLAFSEPADYFPRERWMEQFNGRRLDDDLSLRKKIRPITGATLTGRAITNASRKILAVHEAVQGP